MVNVSLTLPPDYWTQFTPSQPELEFISTYLFEKETPLSEKELLPILIDERINHERSVATRQKKADCDTYLPAAQFKIGQKLAFPALDWLKGKVIGVRPGVNPTMGEFEVIEVELENGAKKEFAASFPLHKLNNPEETAVDDIQLNPEAILADHGQSLEMALAKSLRGDKNLVQVAGKWFPRALLMDVNAGYLNLAEAVLDENGGKPLPTSTLIEQVALPSKENSKLMEFSLNFALQKDGRFDEVGPAGEVIMVFEAPRTGRCPTNSCPAAVYRYPLRPQPIYKGNAGVRGVH